MAIKRLQPRRNAEWNNKVGGHRLPETRQKKAARLPSDVESLLLIRDMIFFATLQIGALI